MLYSSAVGTAGRTGPAVRSEPSWQQSSPKDGENNKAVRARVGSLLRPEFVRRSCPLTRWTEETPFRSQQAFLSFDVIGFVQKHDIETLTQDHLACYFLLIFQGLIALKGPKDLPLFSSPSPPQKKRKKRKCALSPITQ